MNPIVSDTPCEVHEIRGRKILVKREDLCSPAPGPSFAKIRGVHVRIWKDPAPIFGVLDSAHSKAGWGVAWACKGLNRKAVVFYPVFKGETGLRENQRKAEELGAILRPLPGNLMSAVLWNKAKTLLREEFGRKAVLLPNALKLPETVLAVAAEVLRTGTKYDLSHSTVIVSVSSGTIAAGVLKGLSIMKIPFQAILHLGYSRSKEELFRFLKKMADINPEKHLIRVVDEKYQYRESASFQAPFPCNEFYDLKAWKWLTENVETIRTDKILFWNIGA